MSLTSDTLLRIDLQEADRTLDIMVPADTTVLHRVYVSARPSDPAATTDATSLRLWVEDRISGTRASRATTFNGRVPK